MIKIVTDGAADMPESWEKEFDINILPLRVVFGNTTYTQGSNFTHSDFYRLVNQTKTIPKSSLPSIGQVMEFYRNIAQKGDTILSIHITSKLSGTYSTVVSAAKELANEFAIYAFDSGAGSAAQAFLCREARLMDRAGVSITSILNRLEKIRSKWSLVFTLNKLDYAYMSGRINFLQNAVISILNIKPLVGLKDGLLEMVDRTRTRQNSLERVISMIQKKVGNARVNLAVVHAADLESAIFLRDLAEKAFNIKEIIITNLAIPIAANLGPGTVGVIAYPVDEETA
jgi:DegV family protein with EDD domain